MKLEGRTADGRFTFNNKIATGRPKQALGQLNKAMHERMIKLSDEEIYPDQILVDIMLDTDTPLDLRMKAASKVCDLIYPKQNVNQVQIEEPKQAPTDAELTAKLYAVLNNPMNK